MRMDIIFDMFFYTGPGIQVLYKMGFIPKEEDFREMTQEEFQSFLLEHPDGEGEKMFVINRNDREGEKDVILCATDIERGQLLRGAAHLRNLVSNKVCETDEELLQTAARCLPPVFTKGTCFEQKTS